MEFAAFFSDKCIFVRCARTSADISSPHRADISTPYLFFHLSSRGHPVMLTDAADIRGHPRTSTYQSKNGRKNAQKLYKFWQHVQILKKC
jgi:hypothetical protein